MKVGRAALDEDAIRRIEELNPSVEFDWTQILKGGQSSAPAEPRANRPGRNRTERPPAPVERPRRGQDQPQRRGPRAPVDALAQAPPPDPVENVGGIGSITISDEPLPPGTELGEIGEAIEIVDDFGAPPETPAEAAEGLALTPGAADPTAEPPPTPAHGRLGAEGVLRLRARHAEVLARISERVADPVRREELKGQAERLNPDTWVTADEVSVGLEQYESVFEGLRATVGSRRKRRRRRGSRRGPAEAAGAPPEGAADEPAADGDEGGDDGGDDSAT